MSKKEDNELGFLGGLLDGLGRLVEMADKLQQTQINKQGEIDLGRMRQGMKGVFGLSVRTVADNKPIVEPFGNIKKTADGPSVQEEREPMTDVFDEEGEIKVYAEMPGVNEEEIKIEVKGDVLDILSAGERKYRKVVLLPLQADGKDLVSSYKNGILEVRIKK